MRKNVYLEFLGKELRDLHTHQKKKNLETQKSLYLNCKCHHSRCKAATTVVFLNSINVQRENKLWATIGMGLNTFFSSDCLSSNNQTPLDI